MILTQILRILYGFGMLKKGRQGFYYCDPHILGLSRICFAYTPILGKKRDNIKTYCGDWHRITLFIWQIEYLTFKGHIKVKDKVKFP